MIGIFGSRRFRMEAASAPFTFRTAYVNLSGPEFRAFSVRETDDSVEKLCPEHDFDVP